MKQTFWSWDLLILLQHIIKYNLANKASTLHAIMYFELDS